MLSLKALAKLTSTVFKEQITCGFELETQATEGRTADDLGNDDNRQEQINDNCYEIMSDVSMWSEYACKNDFGNAMQYIRTSGKCTWELIEQVAKILNVDSVEEAVEAGILGGSEALEDSIRESLWETIEPEYSDIGDLINVPDGMIAELDSSVNGFEFKTDGACSYTEFLDYSEQIFKLDHDIDTGCSFHIHIAPKDQELRRLLDCRVGMKAMLAYVVHNIPRLPISVQNRIYRKGGLSMFASSGKSGAIIYHCNYDTIEFRLFGNIDNAVDAKRCLDIAIEAVQYAAGCIVNNKVCIPMPAYHSDSRIITIWQDKTIMAPRKQSIDIWQQVEAYKQDRQPAVRQSIRDHMLNFKTPWTKPAEPVHHLLMAG